MCSNYELDVSPIFGYLRLRFLFNGGSPLELALLLDQHLGLLRQMGDELITYC